MKDLRPYLWGFIASICTSAGYSSNSLADIDTWPMPTTEAQRQSECAYLASEKGKWLYLADMYPAVMGGSAQDNDIIQQGNRMIIDSLQRRMFKLRCDLAYIAPPRIAPAAPRTIAPVTASQLEAANASLRKGDCESALQAYGLFATQGNATAQYFLGEMNENGWGIPQNFEIAVAWYRKAADQGQPDAEEALGFMFGDGRGVEKDNVISVAWLEKAAAQGLAMSETSLAEKYLGGEGIQANEVAGMLWLRKAADQGFGFAQLLLGNLYRTGMRVSRDDVLAYKWLTLANSNLTVVDRRLEVLRPKLISMIKDMELKMTAKQLEDARALVREWSDSAGSQAASVSRLPPDFECKYVSP